jgi:hypothetical protein
MEKRIHTKKSSTLTYRHYLFHFKWPLLGFFMTFSFFIFTQLNFTSIFLPYMNHEQQMELFDMNVIYPIDIFNKNINISINSYFLKKEEIKIIDDANAADKKQKIILPLIKNQTIPSNSYLILEFTNVFKRPRFCSHTNEQIFGSTCPYKNW